MRRSLNARLPSPDRAPATESQWRGKVRPLLPQTPAAPARAVTSRRSDTASSILDGRSHKAPDRVHTKARRASYDIMPLCSRALRNGATLPCPLSCHGPLLESFTLPRWGLGLASAFHHLCDHAPVPVRSPSGLSLVPLSDVIGPVACHNRFFPSLAPARERCTCNRPCLKAWSACCISDILSPPFRRNRFHAPLFPPY